MTGPRRAVKTKNGDDRANRLSKQHPSTNQFIGGGFGASFGSFVLRFSAGRFEPDRFQFHASYQNNCLKGVRACTPVLRGVNGLSSVLPSFQSGKTTENDNDHHHHHHHHHKTNVNTNVNNNKSNNNNNNNNVFFNGIFFV